MAEFKYRLETLLRLRQSARDECRLKLTESHRADEAIGRRMARLDDERQCLRNRQRLAATPGEVNVNARLEADRYAALLGAEAERLARQRESLAVEIERRRRSLVEADRDARGLEKLRERQLFRHRREASRSESKRLDEIAMQMAFGKKP